MLRRKELDAASLKALAHPLRVQILRVLEERGQVSVTSLAKELGESTGATSYHLRQLAKHGLVETAEPGEQAAGQAAGQRWWQLAAEELHVQGFGFLGDASTSAAADFLLREAVADRTRRQLAWYASATTWPKSWQAASSGRDAHLTLDPKQTRELADELAALVEKYRGRTPARGARRVDFFYEVFPAGEPS
jgi:DNA-binding transcriptional ArsR family regulator